MTVILDEETLEWHSVTDSLPDADTTVLVYCPDGGVPVWPAYRVLDAEGFKWFAEDRGAYVMPVTAWAEMPLGPQRLWP